VIAVRDQSVTTSRCVIWNFLRPRIPRPAESFPNLHKMFGTARFPDQLFFRLDAYQHFGYVWQLTQHFVLYFMRERTSLPDAEIAIYHDKFALSTHFHQRNTFLAHSTSLV
jgi:hypothetical protein